MTESNLPSHPTHNVPYSDIDKVIEGRISILSTMISSSSLSTAKHSKFLAISLGVLSLCITIFSITFGIKSLSLDEKLATADKLIIEARKSALEADKSNVEIASILMQSQKELDKLSKTTQYIIDNKDKIDSAQKEILSISVEIKQLLDITARLNALVSGINKDIYNQNRGSAGGVTVSIPRDTHSQEQNREEFEVSVNLSPSLTTSDSPAQDQRAPLRQGVSETNLPPDYERLSKLISDSIRNNKYLQAKNYVNQIESLMTSGIEDEFVLVDIARVNVNLGYLQAGDNAIKKAIKKIEDNKERAPTQAQVKLIAVAKLTQGNIAFAYSKYDEALEHFISAKNHAATLYNKSSSDRELSHLYAITLNSVGFSYRIKKQKSAALDNLNLAINIYRKMDIQGSLDDKMRIDYEYAKANKIKTERLL